MAEPPARMRDHWWWRPGVWPGRRLLVWHILADDAPQVRDLARTCQQALRDLPGLDPVPLDWLHMTTLIVGPRDEVTPATEEALIGRARDALAGLAPIAVELGEPHVHAEGVTLGPRPPYALHPIWERLRTASAPAVPPDTLPDDWWAHLSVAYSSADIASAPVAEALRPEPAAVDWTVDWTVREVHLVSQERAGHVYRWERVAAVALG